MKFTLFAGRASRAALAMVASAAVLAGAEFALTPEVRQTLDRISADSLRGNVSFLASDLLEGRATPSPGLDVAAEYIAAQFRRAGLESAGGGDYFQTASLATVRPNREGLALSLNIAGKTYRVPPENIETGASLLGIELANAPLVKAKTSAPGQALLTDLAALASPAGADRLALLPGPPAAVIVLVSQLEPSRAPQPALFDPEDPGPARIPPVVRVFDPELSKAYASMRAGEAGATVTLKVAPPLRQTVKLHNVAGLLRGSDPRLGRTYVMVSAHYDHIGICSNGPDRICNGANDDASGVASVIELAGALAKMPGKPKRSFLFVTYFGEERGLFGSRYYCRHPLVPLAQTVADINLEQLGRTDDTEGPRAGRATLTGFEYSSVGATFARAGELTGVKVRRTGSNSDDYFPRSDNQPLADAGVPAHTVLVAYDFPDYHRPGDEWRKLDYANLEKVDRMIAAGLLMIADDPEPPRWNESSGKTGRYVRAWKELKGN